MNSENKKPSWVGWLVAWYSFMLLYSVVMLGLILLVAGLRSLLG